MLELRHLVDVDRNHRKHFDYANISQRIDLPNISLVSVLWAAVWIIGKALSSECGLSDPCRRGAGKWIKGLVRMLGRLSTERAAGPRYWVYRSLGNGQPVSSARGEETSLQINEIEPEKDVESGMVLYFIGSWKIIKIEVIKGGRSLTTVKHIYAWGLCRVSETAISYLFSFSYQLLKRRAVMNSPFR